MNCCLCNLQGMDKIMEKVMRDTNFFINTELGHHLPVIHLVSFLEQTDISCEQSVVQYCTTLH